jgi:ADP-heptose:LPS heptosyltransferase
MSETQGIRDVARGGIVAAAALSARWTARRATPRALDPRAPRILLLRPDHLGDVLLTTPALAALRAAVPHASITALVGPWAAPAIANNPDVDALVTLPFPGFDRGAAPAGVRAYTQLAAAARALRKQHYDLAVNLRPDFWWGATLLALAGIPRRVGFDLAPGRPAFTDPVSAPGQDDHAVLRSWRALRQAARLLGTDLPPAMETTPELAPLVFRLTDADRAWARDWLDRHDVQAERAPLVLHPGSGAAIKAWPPRKWAAVLTELARDRNAPVIVTGTPDERAEVDAIVRMLPGDLDVIPVAEELPLSRFAALLALARLVLGVDSGPLHLATAVGTPTVRLYGPTSPAIFGPWGPPGAHVALVSTLTCAPCGRLDYSRPELSAHPCVRLIAPADVIAAARSVLRGPRPLQSGGVPSHETPSFASRESIVAQ